MLQGTPCPPVHVVAKFVHEQDAGGMGIAFLVGHAEQWLASTSLPCDVNVIVELHTSRRYWAPIIKTLGLRVEDFGLFLTTP